MRLERADFLYVKKLRVNFNDVLEYFSLVLELEVCGDIHERIFIGGRPLINKYHKGRMKKTLEREVILIRPVWKHGLRSLVWMQDFVIPISLSAGNLDRVYIVMKT